MDSQLLSNLSLCEMIGGPATAIILVDPDLTIRAWNAGAENVYGWTAAEVIRRPLGDIVHTEYLGDDTQATALVGLLETGSWVGEVRQQHRDGSVMLIEASVSLVRDDAGEVVGYIGVNRNVTGQRAVELELERTAHLLTTIVDATPVLVFRLDASGVIRSCEGSGLDVLGLARNDLVGANISTVSQHAAEHLPEARRGNWMSFHDKVLAAGELRTGRHTLCPNRVHDDGLVSVINLA